MADLGHIWMEPAQAAAPTAPGSYESTEFAVFTAAASCQAIGRTTYVSGELVEAADVERAFGAWKKRSGDSTRLTVSAGAQGFPVYEFSPA